MAKPIDTEEGESSPVFEVIGNFGNHLSTSFALDLRDGYLENAISTDEVIEKLEADIEHKMYGQYILLYFASVEKSDFKLFNYLFNHETSGYDRRYYFSDAPPKFEIFNTINGQNIVQHALNCRYALRKKIEQIRLARNDILSPIPEIDDELEQLNKIVVFVCTDLVNLALDTEGPFRTRAGHHPNMGSQSKCHLIMPITQILECSERQSKAHFNKYDRTSPPIEMFEEAEERLGLKIKAVYRNME